MKYFSRYWLALLMVCMLSTAARAVTIDRIVAVVNDEVITYAELSQRTDILLGQLKRQGTSAPPRTQLERQMLERMISERVQMQRARSTGLRVEDSTLERAINRIAEQNNMSLSRFREVLEKQEGVPWARFREDIRQEITLTNLRDRDVDSRVTVSDAEVDALLSSPEALADNKEFLVAHIFLRAPEGATPEAWDRLNLRAAEVLRLSKQGDEFGKLVAAFSDSPDAMQGGVIDWRPVSRLPAVFANEVVRMKKGEVSGALRSAAGLHIFKLNDVREVGATKSVKVEQTHARHILLRQADVLNEADAKRRLLDFKQRIRGGAKFEDIARTNSSDVTSSKGGDLGWVSPGELVPEFERAMNALKPGEVSEPVQTPYGWHLIQVVERRTADVTNERKRIEAYQSLRARKADEAYEAWVRSLRDESFVELRYDEP